MMIDSQYQYAIPPDHPQEVDLAFDVMNLCYGHRQREMCYISTPMTTGMRLVSAVAASQDRSEETLLRLRREAFDDNVREARRVATWWRQFHRGMLLDPTLFERENWSQPDYLNFWGRVVYKLPSFIVFCDGWNYSNGCSYEFLNAVRADIPLSTADGKCLTPREGQGMLQRGAEYLARHGWDNSLVRSVIDALDRHFAEKEERYV